MSTYTVTGHPLNLNDTGLSEAGINAIRTALQANGVGATFTVTLNPADETKARAHGVLK
jgi:hypothetical protein